MDKEHIIREISGKDLSKEFKLHVIDEEAVKMSKEHGKIMLDIDWLHRRRIDILREKPIEL